MGGDPDGKYYEVVKKWDVSVRTAPRSSSMLSTVIALP